MRSFPFKSWSTASRLRRSYLMLSTNRNSRQWNSYSSLLSSGDAVPFPCFKQHFIRVNSDSDNLCYTKSLLSSSRPFILFVPSVFQIMKENVSCNVISWETTTYTLVHTSQLVPLSTTQFRAPSPSHTHLALCPELPISTVAACCQIGSSDEAFSSSECTVLSGAVLRMVNLKLCAM